MNRTVSRRHRSLAPQSVHDANDDVRRRLGARIRQARTAQDLSRSALGRMLPASTEGPDVSRLERGRNMPSWPALQGLAAALDVTVAWLLAEDGTDELGRRVA
jgi:transcriptional regulator with XRE-family HTH domain